jgi:transcriptional regulator with XRE-family HTH domain
MHELADFLPKLQAARAKDHRTQKQLAAECGCSQGEISRILAGRIKYMHGAAYRLCQTLKVPTSQAFEFDLESHLSRIEIAADLRQRELIHVIRHAYSRINVSPA